MKPLYIFDLDGTLADQMHRRHYIESGDWMSYFEACLLDAPIMPVIRTLERLYYSGAEIWVFSGRSDHVRAKTAAWLDLHVDVHFNDARVMMRRTGDMRPDDVIKQEMLDNMLDVDRQRLVAVFDDRDRVVAMWRRNGIQCFQVAPGDF